MRIEISQLRETLPPVMVGKLTVMGFFKRAECINEYLDTGKCVIDDCVFEAEFIEPPPVSPIKEEEEEAEEEG